MDGLSGAQRLKIELEWQEAPGVSTRELGTTWCRMSVWIGRQCLTGVEDQSGSFRRSVYTSAYPLAEWIAFNWWFLTSEIRPSAIEHAGWSWSNVRTYEWLRRHNLRAAGNGMPWPNATIVPEGAVTRVTWHSGQGLAGQPINFVLSGSALLPSNTVVEELARLVDEVLDRLQDVGVGETPLSKEWQAIRTTDAEEADFAKAAARLGLDAYSMEERDASDLLSVASELKQPLLDEFLDSAEPHRLGKALRWLQRAQSKASELGKEQSGLPLMPAGSDERGSRVDDEHPWEQGYATARAFREALGLRPADRADVEALVPKAVVDIDSAGIQGFALGAATGDSISLVLPAANATTATRFAQARALGLLLLGGPRREFILDPASTHLTKKSRAFAAELLAPADGIAQMMSRLPGETEAAFDAVAKRFDASPLLVRRQYENQVLA